MTMEYRLGSELTFDQKLSQQVYDLVRESAKDANRRHRIYDDATLEVFLDTYKPDRIWTWLKPDIVSVFAYDGDKLIGTGFLSHKDYEDLPRDGTTARANGLYVHPGYKGHGVADAIWRLRIEHARKNGIRIIRGISLAFPDTMRFHERHGTKIVREINLGDRLKSYEIEFDLTK